jgi:hypothetical protein
MLPPVSTHRFNRMEWAGAFGDLGALMLGVYVS